MSKQMLDDQTWSSPEIRSSFPTSSSQMSYGGVVVKTCVFVILIAGLAVVGWTNAATYTGKGAGLVYLIGYIVLIAITIAAGRNPKLALPAGLLYSVLTGVWMGAISRYYDEVFDGVVGIALLSTFAITIAMLLLYSLKVFRVTAKFAQILGAMVVGVGLLYLIGWILSLFGIRLDFLYGTSTTAIVVGLIILGIAAATLLLDFANVEQGVKVGAPKAAEWFAALGIVSSLVWIYLEVLRLLARIGARN